MNINEQRRNAFYQAELAAKEFLYRFYKEFLTIPQSIINGYIETLLAKQEICPISLILLTKDTICITKCGHAFSHLSMKHWIQDAHSCPVCREPVSEHELQVYCP